MIKAYYHGIRLCILSVVLFAQIALAQTTQPIGERDYLQTRGNQIINRDGKVVHLHGVNIGGWLVTEGWMCGQLDDPGRGALEQLEARFGTEKAASLMKVWQDNWFTTRDLDLIQSWGMNVIRVPFHYRNLQDAKGKWIRDGKGNIDFSRMDWVVKEAGNRGMYVIFVFHVWPRQMEKDNYGLPSRWSDEGKIVREQMRVIWTEIARHFKGNAVIAGFDVINEPEGSPWNAPHHAFSDAIRKEDPDRMVIVEWSGYEKTPKEFPNNTVYSDHYAFKTEATLDKFSKSLAAHPEVNVPLFLGEMKAGTDDTQGAKWMAEAMNKQGWHWCIWTYKAVNNGGWAAFNYHNSFKYDLSKDSYEDLYKKWSTQLTQWQNEKKTTNHQINKWWVEGFGGR